jgi:hypothetical protein
MSSQARAAKHHARLVQIAVELYELPCAEAFFLKSSKSQENMLAAASRLMTRRVGQGHSR